MSDFLVWVSRLTWVDVFTLSFLAIVFAIPVAMNCSGRLEKLFLSRIPSPLGISLTIVMALIAAFAFALISGL